MVKGARATIAVSINHYRFRGKYITIRCGKQGKLLRSESAAANDAVRTEAGESTAVNDNPERHTAEQQRIIEEHKNAVDERLVGFYNHAKNNQNGPPYPLHDISERAAEDILSLTG